MIRAFTGDPNSISHGGSGEPEARRRFRVPFRVFRRENAKQGSVFPGCGPPRRLPTRRTRCQPFFSSSNRYFPLPLSLFGGGITGHLSVAQFPLTADCPYRP
ncbi:Hypothetical protein NTJ_04137 [Nesidiocoris tenuis]|uniref:Uncharacterized protein n=1 Tax=Nesidiocoris tenuis TaxID=355587 RepID=A0ABN7AGH2_9HEMI|nr:Hypothetical protein NTJ_04137 [Nesidiocoris tenuis]